MINLFGQVNQLDTLKYDKLVNDNGIMKRYIDYNIDTLDLSFGKRYSTIRKLVINNKTFYFFQIPLRHGEDARVSYNNFLLLENALKKLKSDSIQDSAKHPDDLGNSYITGDGVEFGYRIGDENIEWTVTDHNKLINNWAHFNNYETLDNSIKLAEEKFKSLIR